jgi:hypothetical protein
MGIEQEEHMPGRVSHQMTRSVDRFLRCTVVAILSQHPQTFLEKLLGFVENILVDIVA